MQERTEKINKLQPDLVISLHVNKNTNEEANGIEAYVSEQNERFEASKAHAEELISVLSDNKLRSRGVKIAPMYLLKIPKARLLCWNWGFCRMPMTEAT
ncbi:N-acetylmuramoyl-L-alanine amidase [Flavobacterium lindanitolerans]|nr:N-acetylmuramoyl-L-alanine amidase [Flavobacterium lindanitolerans]